MEVNPHNTCAHILNTLRSSGLTYTLNETPYSVYLTVRKKFTKEYTPTQATIKKHQAPELNNNVVDMSKYEDILTKLHEEISNHILTKQELCQREEELSQSVDANNANIEDSRMTHFRQIETISKLTDDLAQEVDDHAQSEAALRKLEEKVEILNAELEKANNSSKAIAEEKESLQERLKDAQEEIDKSNKVIVNLEKKLLHHKVNQTGTPRHAHLSNKSSSSSSGLKGVSVLQSDTDSKTLTSTVDLNCNLPHEKSLHKTLGSDFSSTHLSSRGHTTETLLNKSLTPPHASPRRDNEKYCQNCKNKLPEDLNISLPPPIYFHNFLAECPSPWLHHGYCKKCLVAARFINSTIITEHIAQCPAILDQCPDVEHKLLIAEYIEKENDTKNPEGDSENKSYNLSPYSPSALYSNTSPPCSSTSSPDTHYRTNPEKYCQKCKNEVIEVEKMQLPCPIQFFDLLTECPSPWLHYGYCTPCLEDSRLTGTDILNHIIHCETLFKRCQDNKLASHIELYQRTEAKIAGKILSADSPP